MPRFVLQLTVAEAFAALFKQSADGNLEFGWTAISTEHADMAAVVDRPIRFRDYIMEGFVVYSVQLLEHAQGSELAALGLGGNRDQYILPQVRAYLKAASIPIERESA